MTDPFPSTSVFYLDTSALVKRYAAEVGSDWVIALCASSAENVIVVARITYVEAAAAFAIKHRTGGMSPSDYEAVLAALQQDFANDYALVEIEAALVKQAVDLTKRQKLRGYDAVQLAAALTLNKTLTQGGFQALTFISADKELLQAAQQEGLVAENPLSYP